MNWLFVTGVGVTVVSLLWFNDYLFTSLTVAVHLLFATLGIYLGLSWSLLRGKQYTPPPLPKELEHPHISMLLQNMMEAKTGQRGGPKKVVISRNMDLALQEVIDLVLRDFVLSWYKDLSLEQDSLLAQIQSDLWILIGQISDRLSKVDTVQFVTQDVVEKLQTHFQDIRLASKKIPGEERKAFMLLPWLHSEETELNYLRKISEALLLIILPKPYAKSTPVRHLLREVVANTVLKPTIDLICDPDYINQTLIAYIEYREKLSEDTRKTYTYAPTYEEFVKIIDKSEDIEHLKQLRLNIMTEIMQATTINNLKKRQSIAEKPGSPKSNKRTAKGELLKARDLKKYINQLTVAKARSEKRIHRLGGPDYKYYTEDVDEMTSSLPGHKVLGFAEIMESPVGRDHFASFLKRDDKESLLGFWNGVEMLKEADKRQHHHIATDIYQRYISSNTSVVKVDKATAKAMENFMLGNSGPGAFFEAQEQTSKVLEEQHYPSFLVSDLYHRYVTSMEDGGYDLSNTVRKDELFFEPKEGWSDDDEEGEMFSAQSYHAKQKLQQLDQRIVNKTQAVEALRASSKADSKIQKVVDEELEKELEGMKIEKRNLESHIMRTETWCENVGKWRAHVYEVMNTNEGDKNHPLFVLVIHLSGSTGTSFNLQNSSQGWVVNRKLPDFYGVHEKLVQIAGSWLKNKDLPKIGRFTTVDEKFLKEAKNLLNEYLSTVMKDERLAQSEALYGFLTPTPEYFQQPGQEKKSGFFLKNLLKSAMGKMYWSRLPGLKGQLRWPVQLVGEDGEGHASVFCRADDAYLPSIGQETRVPDEELLFSVEDRTEDRSKDSIAEPLYRLINEVYELHGMFKWLRKSFIAFVEISFGKSINRQLRETVYWIFSESMLIYYIHMFKDSMWPNGMLAESLPAKSDEEKLKTRIKAKEKFLLNQPDAVKTLVGEENARRGTIKMFEVLQDVRLNKHLFYMLLQVLLVHMIPDLGPVFNQDSEQEDRDNAVLISSSEINS